MASLAARLFIYIAILITAKFCLAEDNAESSSVVNTIRYCIEHDEIEKVWDIYTSEFYKARSKRQQFIEVVRRAHLELGAPKAGMLLQSSVSFNDPSTGYRGVIHTYDFRTDYKLGTFIERFVVIKETDGKFRLAGLWSQRALPGQ